MTFWNLENNLLYTMGKNDKKHTAVIQARLSNRNIKIKVLVFVLPARKIRGKIAFYSTTLTAFTKFV